MQNKVKCECGEWIDEQQLNSDFNKLYETKMCRDCMDIYAHHALTGE